MLTIVSDRNFGHAPGAADRMLSPVNQCVPGDTILKIGTGGATFGLRLDTLTAVHFS